METVNSLKFSIETTSKEGDQLIIDIRLSDDCRNGHNDFAITGSIYKKGRARTDKNFLAGGCLHDEILAVRPDLKIFVDLHLSDYAGVPMYPIANGFYHLKNSSEDVAREYMRATREQFEALRIAEDKDHFAYIVERLELRTQWKAEAGKAIELLEKLTGKKFVDNSKKSQWDGGLTQEQKTEIDERLKNGYYSPENRNQRANNAKEQAKQKAFEDIRKERDAEILKAENEYKVKYAVLAAGLPLGNFIYYTHINQGAFNWNTSTYNPAITKEQFDVFIAGVNMAELPEGITFKLK